MGEGEQKLFRIAWPDLTTQLIFTTSHVEAIFHRGHQFRSSSSAGIPFLASHSTRFLEKKAKDFLVQRVTSISCQTGLDWPLGCVNPPLLLALEHNPISKNSIRLYNNLGGFCLAEKLGLAEGDLGLCSYHELGLFSSFVV